MRKRNVTANVIMILAGLGMIAGAYYIQWQVWKACEEGSDFACMMMFF